MVDGWTTDGRTDDDGRRLDGYTISSPCEPNGSGELKTNILVSDLVRQNSGCTATEDGKRLEISDLEIRGIALSM